MGISRLLSSTDTSAPQLQGTLGSLAAVLKAALVDGYGTTDPLGWTLEYTADTNYRMAFRNNPTTGTGFYFKINDNYSTNTRQAMFSAYEQMTGIDTYTNPLLASESSPYIFHKSYYNTSQGTAVPWFIIGDDRGFWLRTLGEYQRGTGYVYENCGMTCFIGDYNKLLAGSVYNFCFAWSSYTSQWVPGGAGANDTTYTTFPRCGREASTIYAAIRIMRDSSGSVGAVTGRPCHSIGNTSWTNDSSYGAASSYNGVYPFYSKVMIADSLYKFIGSLPGCFFIDIEPGTTSVPVVYQQTIVDGGNKWMICPSRESTALGVIALQIGAGWRDDI